MAETNFERTCDHANPALDWVDDPTEGEGAYSWLSQFRLHPDVVRQTVLFVHGLEGWPQSVHRLIRPQRSDSLKAEFRGEVNKWYSETAYESSLTRMVLHPSYQRIIALGPPVIPLLLEELENRPGHWFWALQALTNQDPVPPGAAGDLERMRQAWLRWGRDQHLI